LTLKRPGLTIEAKTPGDDHWQEPTRRTFWTGIGAKGAVDVVGQAELSRIIISEENEQQIIFLKEVNGDRTFPIVIGIFEATSINRRVKGLPAPRPLTHDLVASTIDRLGGELEDILISGFKDSTYFAKLRIRHEGELIEVDSRPSDAIVMALTADVPIYVSGWR
jgi:uncharacterized protein